VDVDAFLDSSSDRPAVRAFNAAAFSAVYPAVKAMVDESDAERVVLGGFSLGGPVATFLAVALAMAYPDKRVDAVSFSPLRAFNDAFSTLMQETINARTVVFEWDAIPQGGCAKVPACRADKATGEIVEYAEWPGLIFIKDEDLGEPEDMSSLQIVPAHVCSYLCWAVRISNTTDPVNWCQKAPRSDGLGKGNGMGMSDGDICPFSTESVVL